MGLPRNKRDGSSFRDAATGKVLFQVKSGTDVGRCMAADIDPTNPGVEMWSWESKGLRNIKGEVINPDIESFSTNMAVWWDGDLLRELLDKNVVSKYDWKAGVANHWLLSPEPHQTAAPKQLPVCKATLSVTGVRKFSSARKTTPLSVFMSLR